MKSKNRSEAVDVVTGIRNGCACASVDKMRERKDGSEGREKEDGSAQWRIGVLQ